MKVQDLTDQNLLDIYNANFGEELDKVKIDRNSYGTIEVNHVDGYDDMVLTLSDKGAIYLFCLDNHEIYHDVAGALKMLHQLEVEPFFYPKESK